MVLMIWLIWLLVSSFSLHLFGTSADIKLKVPALSYPLSKHVFYIGFGQKQALVGSALPGAEEFSLASIGADNTVALAPSRVTINEKKDQENPLYNQPIQAITLMRDNPLVVGTKNPDTLYYFSSLNTDQQISLLSICLGDSTMPRHIRGLSHALTGSLSMNENYICAAITDSNGTMGIENTGIALLQFFSQILATREHYFDYFDAVTGQSQGKKPYHLDFTSLSQGLSINNGIESIKFGDMYWDPIFERLYIGLHIKTKDDASVDQGGCALLIGRIDPEKHTLSISSGAPWATFNDSTIIGTMGAHKYVSIDKIRSYYSSMGLPYLIVVGGKGNSAQMKKMVYALPLQTKQFPTRLDCLRDAEHGIIAPKNCMVRENYQTQFPQFFGRFKGRIHIERSNQDQDDSIDRNFYTQHDSAVMVGGTAQLPHDITDLKVVNDTVFVSVAEEDNQQKAGIFYSQAIFDGKGNLAAWTPWKRAIESQAGIIGFDINTTDGSLYMLEKEAVTSTTTIFRNTQWAQPAPVNVDEPVSITLGLAGILNKEFPRTKGGILGLFDFDYTTPGLSGLTKTSLLVATGSKKVVLVQTGYQNERGIFTAWCSDVHDKIMESANGSVQGFSPDQTRVISITGGVLDEIGDITCAQIAHNETDCWLIVGGTGGVAILTTNEGRGWLYQQGLQNSFMGLSGDMSFKKIGNYRYIRKLMSDDSYLYILSRDTFDRFQISADNIMRSGVIGMTTLATPHTTPGGGKFVDAGVSGPLTLLGTTAALLRTGNHTDVRYALGKDDIEWVTVDLSQPTSIVKLFFVSSTGHENGFSLGGQVFVLNGSLSDNRAQIHRFFIDNSAKHGITDTIIQRLPDKCFKDQYVSFINLSSFRTIFATDGCISMVGRGRHLNKQPFVQILPTDHVGGALRDPKLMYEIPLNLTDANTITAIIKNSASGSWMISGDFGVRIHQ